MASTRPSHLAARENLANEARRMASLGYLTPHEVAAKTGQGLASVYRWMRSGNLKSKQTGGRGRRARRWVKKDDLERFVSPSASWGKKP